MNKIKSKPSENFVFDPYPRRIMDLIDDLDGRLDDLEMETLHLILELIYKCGFQDGLDFRKWLEE